MKTPIRLRCTNCELESWVSADEVQLLVVKPGDDGESTYTFFCAACQCPCCQPAHPWVVEGLVAAHVVASDRADVLALQLLNDDAIAAEMDTW